MLRKLILFITILSVTLSTGYLLLATPILARDPVPPNGDYQTDVFEPAIASSDVNLQSTVYEVYLALVSSINRSLFCYAPQGGNPDDNCYQVSIQTTNAGSNSDTYAYGGAIPALYSLNTQFLSQPTISSTEYIAAVGEKLNLTQPAYAQGLGYEGLRPVLRLWEAFRNIAYLLATLGFIILAFMVMFRIKAGSQAVITAQTAITKLVFVVLAVTFSYAIAGFVVDLIYLFTALIIQLYVATGILTGTGATAVQTDIVGGTVWSTIMTFTGGLIPGGGIGAGANMDAVVSDFFNATGNFPAILDWILGESIGIILRVIIAIAIVYSMFKLFIQLLFAYLQIILLTVLSPILILPDILPGGNAFMSWVRNIFAHAMIFPVTVFMFITGIAIVDVNEATGYVTNTAADEIGLALPLLNMPSSTLYPLIGIGFILITPKINDMVKNALKVSSFQYMSEIGAAVGYGTGRAMAPVSGAGRLAGFGAGQAARYELSTRAEALRRKSGVDPKADSRAKLYEGVVGFGERRKWW